MKVRLGDDGEWFAFDGGRLLVKEARELEELTGMGLQDFAEGIKRGKVNSLVFMLYISMKRAGVAVRWRDFDDADVGDLQIDDEGEAEAYRKRQAEAEAAADEERRASLAKTGTAPSGGSDAPPAEPPPAEQTPRAAAVEAVADARDGAVTPPDVTPEVNGSPRGKGRKTKAVTPG